MTTAESFGAYLSAPFAESLEKDYQAAAAAVVAAELGDCALQQVLEAIAPLRHHMAFAKKAGLFLAAAQQRLGRDAVLDLSVLGEEARLDCAGAFGQRHDLTVKGDLGSHAGAHLASGTLTVEGDVEDYCGAAMAGGKIVVKGLAENHLGHSMRGGEILVHRNAHDFIGNRMTGGHIVVQANAGYSAGYKMTGGLIEIKDLAWDLCGEEMVGGRIEIGGHIGRDLGMGMAGGELALIEAHKDTPRVKATGGKVAVLAKGKKRG